MATNVKVVGTDLRQVTIKVNPGTYLTEILEQACLKLKVPHDKYLLKHKQRQLDLSQTFRTSGLIAGARLELVVRANTPTAVNVALQFPSPESNLFPPHGRVSEKFPTDYPVWKILRQFESGRPSAGKNLNITARGVPQTSNGTQAGSGQLYYEMPNIVIEKRTLSTFQDFQKSLLQLGYNSGSVLMRLSFQITDQPLSDAMREIDAYFETEKKDHDTLQKTEEPGTEEMSAIASASASASASAAASAAVPPSESNPDISGPAKAQSNPAEEPRATQDTPGTDATVNDQGISSNLQPVTIFSAPTSSTPVAALRPDAEEDYAPDISHAKAHQRRLKSLAENKRLLSDVELEQKAAEEEAKFAAVKSIKIKVRFPDNFSAEWVIGPEDTGATLYSAVKSILANSSAQFKLVLPGVRTVIKDESEAKLIKGYRLTANTLVNFTWDDSVPADVRRQPLLKASAASKAQEVVVPDVPEIEVEQAHPSAPAPAPKPSNDTEGSALKKPKWLKAFGKK
ncbi:GLUT4 regulating protein TUG-domain-containing protein [Xylaria sp. CBS 124048]|nr:GLUT4 regulating protein TUG-domain-containing protein [Xylaria sp. CBS 124048]